MPVTPIQAVQKAYTFLQKGDKLNARHWATYAAQTAPGLEDAWLMLAACSSPRASVAYLQRALEINPSSQRARQGLHWARKRLFEEQRAQRLVAKPTPALRPKPKKRFLWWIWTLLVLVIFSVSLVFAFLVFGSVRADSPRPVAAQIWADSTLKPSEPTLSATPVILASSTPIPASPTPTQSPTASQLPTETATISPTFPPTATLALEPPTPTSPPPTPTTEPTSAAHTVQDGESAESIAIWYGIQVSALLAANGLDTSDQIQPGLELFIPPVEYVAPPPSYSIEKLILVDISEQHMYVYEGDQLIYSFVASTGMGNSTRVGTFEVLNKIPNAYGATWNIWMPSWLGIYWSGHLQNGIHALPILPNGATLWAGYLGTPISYGCVVLGSYEAQLLYDWAEVGTTVQIQW
jgi:LysM repeat protein